MSKRNLVKLRQQASGSETPVAEALEAPVITHDTKMPWGTHVGKPIGEVPFDYLLRLYRKMWLGGEVLQYFETQLRELEREENDIAPLEGKKPKKWLIEGYECVYPKKTAIYQRAFEQG